MDCGKFYLVQSGDSCDGIIEEYDITLDKFYSWNPAMGISCYNLDVGDYIFVGIDATR